MRLDAGLDTGEMLLAQVVPIGQEETAVDVYGTLAPVGAELMVKTLNGLECGTIFPQAQDHAMATLAPILKREDGWMDFSRTAKQLHDRWRGFQPWPGAHTSLRGKKLIVHRMHPVDGSDAEAGALVVRGDLLMVGCGDGTMLCLDEVQMEGKRRMSAAEFLRWVSGEKRGAAGGHEAEDRGRG